MNRKTRKYTKEFKQDAMELALRSASVSQTANESGINMHEELKKLRKENANLKEEREILKKAAAYFAREIR